MSLSGKGLEHFAVHLPAALAELMNEGSRDRAQLQVAGVVIHTFFLDRLLRLLFLSRFIPDHLNAARLPNAESLDDAQGAIRYRPVDFGRVPELDVLLGVGQGGFGPAPARSGAGLPPGARVDSLSG